MQLDLFAHSRDVMLRNDATNALRARDIGAARKALAALAGERPDDPLLAPAAILLDCLRHAPKRFAEAAAADLAATHLLAQVEPAAQQVFGAAAAPAWLRPLWQDLADAAARLPYHCGMPSAHAAGMLLRAGNWPAAAETIRGIESWRRIPVPLAWMAEARFAQDGLESAWPLLAELAWLDPPRFGALAARLDASGLKRLLRGFERDFATGDDVDLAWFPACALISEPRLASVLCEAGTPAPDDAEQAARILMQLLALERQGRHAEIVERRRKLRALHEALFAHYMQTRE
jgi:hypothetical protein